MRANPRRCSTAALLVFVTAAATAFGADATLVASCNHCHGQNGISTAQDVPTIAGISVPVAVDALKSFKSKTRPCGEHGNMCDIAGRLSDADITALAEQYSKLPYVHMKQPVDAAQAAAGKAIAQHQCEICHTKGGTDPTDDAGLLGGQPLGWLKGAIADVKDGKMPQPKMMRAKTMQLSDSDAKALAEYYASL
ncbi:MAG TPA: c-type cytochrome [Steroidobacteraceae bacterium]|nr:c-type cytochrome [Steroidobacteraceae bacterium]